MVSMNKRWVVLICSALALLHCMWNIGVAQSANSLEIQLQVNSRESKAEMARLRAALEEQSVLIASARAEVIDAKEAAFSVQLKQAAHQSPLSSSPHQATTHYEPSPVAAATDDAAPVAPIIKPPSYAETEAHQQQTTSVVAAADANAATGVEKHPQKWSANEVKNVDAIVPLLSVSLAVDPHRWLFRLLESIDAPIGRILVQIGNPDRSILDALQQQIDEALEKNSQYLGSNVEVTRLDHNPGCTNGWNIGMRPMMQVSEEELPWAVIVNSDVAFHKGSLAALSEYMTRTLASDARFGLGHLNIHPPWSGFAATWRLATTVGLFDENIYPVGYEDNDYSIRVQLANLRVSTVQVANVQHNVNYDGSDKKVSQSGTGIALKDKATGQQLQGLLDRGQAAARAYLQKKWGGHIVPTFFKGPFNDARIPVSEWPNLPQLREHIVTGRGSLNQALQPIDDLISKYSTHTPIVYKEPAYKLKEEPTFCALEGEMCDCHGEVIYGPVLRGKWGDSLSDDDHYAGTTSLEQMQQGPHNTKKVVGRIACATATLGDPHFGELKYCRCLRAPNTEIPDSSTFCAFEDEICPCTSSVIYGAIHQQGAANSKPRMTSMANMLRAPHLRRDVDDNERQVMCSQDSFDGDDPSYGERKYCRCSTPV